MHIRVKSEILYLELLLRNNDVPFALCFPTLGQWLMNKIIEFDIVIKTSGKPCVGFLNRGFHMCKAEQRIMVTVQKRCCAIKNWFLSVALCTRL